MASTTLAVLHAGAVPVFCDVHSSEWTMGTTHENVAVWLPVSLYGLRQRHEGVMSGTVDDAAQTLQTHGNVAFTSYSFQASKILAAGEGGMLVTNDSALAERAQQFRDLGYPAGKTIGSLKHPLAVRHEVIGWNYRMSDAQAQLVLDQLPHADELLAARRYSAQCYREAIAGCELLSPQYVPKGWPHSYWSYAIALHTKEMWEPFVAALEAAGAERPYAAWLPTYKEPAFRHLAPDGTCPVAEDLQPRLVQLQTGGNHHHPEQAAEALRCAVQFLDARYS